MSETIKQKLNVYCCGGAGINIGKSLDGTDDHLEVIYLDSSVSNIDKLDKDTNAFLIRDMDGAGKLRSKTYEAFKSEVEAALTKFKPSKGLNVVISSLSGGTGSVIAPLIARELIISGQTVIVIGIASTSSVIETENTIKAIKTYNNFSVQHGKPIAMFYCDHEVRSEADDTIKALMVSLSLITDKSRTREFDSTDLHHFINYNKVTSLPIGLSNLQISINNDDSVKLTDDAHLASTILITTDTDSVLSGEKPEYLATVIVTDENYLTKEGNTPLDIRMDNIVGLLPSQLKSLEDDLEKAKDKVKTSHISKIELAESVDDSGMVL